MMAQAQMISVTEKARDFLARYRRAYETHRVPMSDFNPLLFVHLKRNGKLDFVDRFNLTFPDVETEREEALRFRDLADIFPEPREEDPQLFDLLNALDPTHEELRFMRGLGVSGSNEEFDELFHAENYPALVDEAFAQFESLARGTVGELLQPMEVTTLMAHLHPSGGGVKLYDPFAKLCGVGAKVPPEVEYLGQEQDAKTLAIEILRSQAHGRYGTYLNQDALAHWNPTNEKFNVVLINLRFGKTGELVREVPFPTRNAASLAIQLALDSLEDNGKIVALLPEQFLFSVSASTLRGYLVSQGLLATVISLPIGTFAQSAIKTSIIVLDRSKLAGTDVRFIDADQFITSRSKNGLTLDVQGVLMALASTSPVHGVVDVNATQLTSDEQVSWSLSRFSSQLHLAQITSDADGSQVVELETVLHDDILSLGEHVGLPLFQVSELSTELLDMTRTALHGRTDQGSTKKGPVRLDVHALLLARVGGKLKPTLFDPSEGPIAVGSNVFIFRIDTDRVDPEYLATELRSSAIQDQLDAYHQGSTIPSIAKADLLRIRVRLPGIAEQRGIVRERKEAVLIARREEIARQEKLHGLTTEEWRMLGAVEHSFRPVLAMVQQPMEEIRAAAEMLRAEPRDAIDKALGRMNVGLDRMRELFKLINAVIRSDKDSLRPVPVDLRRLFRNEVRGIQAHLKNIRVYFQCEAGLDTEDGVIARLDQQQFALFVQNLLTNMAKHAMRPGQEELTVLVRVTSRTDPGRTWTVITIENDGRPFSEGFDHTKLVTFGSRGDANMGNGIGGFLMDRIIANHGGRFHSGNIPLDEGAARKGFSEDQRLDQSPWMPHDWDTVLTHMAVFFTVEIPVDNSNGNE